MSTGNRSLIALMLWQSAFFVDLAAAALAKPEQVHLAVGLDPTTQATVAESGRRPSGAAS